LTTPATLVTKTQYAYTDNTLPASMQKTDNLSSATSTDTYTYFDGLKRPIQERKEAEAANTYSVTDMAYNSRGLIASTSLPYFSTGASRTSATSTASLFINQLYDPVLRLGTTTIMLAP
jgi:hypothetical protein